MSNQISIQEKMYLELLDKCIFDQVQAYAYQYLDNTFERALKME